MNKQKNHHKMMVQQFRRRFTVSSLLTLPVLALSPLVQELLGFSLPIKGEGYLLFAFSSLVFFYGGWPFLKGLVQETKKKQPGMMTLIGTAISTAYLYSSAVVWGLEGRFFFWEIVTLIDVMLLGHWIEMRSLISSSRALKELAQLLPSAALLVKQDGEIEEVPISKLAPGDRILVKPGEKIASDGEVVKGETSVNEALLTGESKPVSKKKGDKVIGGSINKQGSIEVKVTHTGKDSYVSQIVDLVKKAQRSKSKAQDLASRAALWLTVISISIGAATLAVWLLLGKELAFALERTVTVMVITCPHALGLAVPLVISVSTSKSARAGILIRNRIPFEGARNVETVVFDKTGTLTKGEFGVTGVIPLNHTQKNQILLLAASLEQKSEHPIAKAVLKKAEEKGVNLKEPSHFSAIPGKGVKAKIDGKEIKVVGENYLKENKIAVQSEKTSSLKKQGKTLAYILSQEKPVGVIALADLIREESRQAVTNLKKRGIKTVMLTGDSRQAALWVKKELGMHDFFAEVLPHDKQKVIKDLQKEAKVAMVGDGINDAPALTQADVGIAIGAGTDVAIESADIVLVRDDPRDVVSAIDLSKATYKKIKQNLIWATAYNVLAIPLAAGVLLSHGVVLSPAVGAGLMSLSTVIVAINANFLET